VGVGWGVAVNDTADGEDDSEQVTTGLMEWRQNLMTTTKVARTEYEAGESGGEVGNLSDDSLDCSLSRCFIESCDLNLANRLPMTHATCSALLACLVCHSARVSFCTRRHVRLVLYQNLCGNSRSSEVRRRLERKELRKNNNKTRLAGGGKVTRNVVCES